ncbi:MAG: phosphoribosylanthranilate isomerase [Chloroflexi bacterium]|nr:phosphoribosylanthranilate isomerase [Chloroflexota bacterium]MBE3115359.1 phosphoribosylanthranilate isomerase [Actinomycetota bacterium]
MVWIKICGITNIDDAKSISELRVDAMGFVLSADSPRRIEVITAYRIIEALRTGENKISMVGIFVNEEIGRVLNNYRSLRLDYIQLSGDEDRDYLKDLKEKAKDIKIIKSIRIKNKSESYSAKINKKVDKLKEYADFILMDSYSKNVYGGTGMSFNWDIVKDYYREIPVILSGGLDAENVRQAVDIVKPFGVDASSKLEIYPGKKDIDKVTKFINVLK